MAALPPQERAPRITIAPDMPVADSARLALVTGVAAMKHHEAAAIAGEIEPIHQMRVAMRRLRATVQLFAGVIHGSRVRVYKRDLPWLGQTAGAVRECDVIEALIRECGERLEPALAGALTPLYDALADSRQANHQKFVEELRSKRYVRMCARLADPLLRRAIPATEAGCYAPEMIAPIARSVRKAGKRIGPDAQPMLFHRLRVRVKRLRYALEMLADLGGKRLRKALMRLEQMQELLGMHQDAVSTMTWLRSYAASAVGVAPETLMAAGATIQMLVIRRRKLAARACRQWRKIARSGVIRDALGEISREAERRLESARHVHAEAERQIHAAAAQRDGAERTAGDEESVVTAGASEPIAPVAGESALPAPADPSPATLPSTNG
jgi:CHAD domain-containing protein